MAETLSVIVAIAFIVAVPIAIVRGLIGGVQGLQQDRSSGSFVASSMLEMDRFIRPSTGHIVEAQEDMKRHEDGISGE